VTGDEDALVDALRRLGEDPRVGPSEFLSRPGTWFLLAEENGVPVGRAYGQTLVHPDGETTALLYAVDVVADARRRGHGRRLVEAFVEQARAAGHTEVWVLTDDNNPAGIALYAAAGGRRDATDQALFTWKLRPGRHSSD
jgi:ribosomal protein S18 acetylase RimI-like enzyme